jgi:hypothetical protein
MASGDELKLRRCNGDMYAVDDPGGIGWSSNVALRSFGSRDFG